LWKSMHELKSNSL